MLRVLAVTGLALGFMALPLTGGAQSVFRGENVLAFAARLQARATPASVHDALDGMLERLEVADDRRAAVVNLRTAPIRRATHGANLPTTGPLILLAAGAVKLGSANGTLVVAEGDVEIGDARNAVVVSRGNVRIARESTPGIYVARRAIAIDSGVSPIVYAVDGAKVTSSEPFTAYNSAVKIEGGYLAYLYTRPPLFQGEPIRPPEDGGMQVDSGESVLHSGVRCKTAIADNTNVLSQLLPHARRMGNCTKVDSAVVRCEQEDAGADKSGSRELWALQMCGKEMNVRVESKRTGKATPAGEPLYDHSIVVQSGAQPARQPRPLPARPTAFAAEDALALAGVPAAQVPRARVVQAVRRVFEALQLPPDLQAKYAFIGSARLQVEPGFAESVRLSETILVADGAVKVGVARNSIIIARGPVEIAHGGGLIVIADGPVSLSHESGPVGTPFVPGVYVTRGSVEVSHSAGPVIYAVEGTRNFGYGRTTLVNTTFSPAATRADPVAYTVPPLFSGESPRPAVARPAPAGVPPAYAGKRCPDVMPEVASLMDRMQAYAKTEAACSTVDVALVECAQAPSATNRFTSIERWTFELCDRKLTIVSRVSGYIPPKPGDQTAGGVTSEMYIERSPTPLESTKK